MASTSQHFFRKVDKPNPTVQSMTLLDVGGCGYKTLAEWILRYFDDFLIHPRVKTQLMAFVLKALVNEFPAYNLSRDLLLTPVQCFRELKEHMPKLADDLAYTLRQIARDEICANPLSYNTVFKGGEGALDASLVATLDDHAAAALAKALLITLDVQDVGDVESIYLQTRYQGRSADPGTLYPRVVLQRLNDHYYLLSIGANALMPLPKCNTECVAHRENHQASNASTAKLEINRDTQRLLTAYHEAYDELALVEMNKSDLLSIYSKYIVGLADDEPMQSGYIGTEHGLQQFYGALSGVASLRSTLPKVAHDEHIMVELKRAVARAISLGYLSLNTVYDCLEAPVKGMPTC